ncbi:hypothetical protein IHE61_22845 [Streptomyces sp. GKU 257-1]|nr:hypothetical protein [Streptomyces sp. GKU 257-1]
MPARNAPTLTPSTLHRLAAERATGAFTRAGGTLFLVDGHIVHAESSAATGLEILLNRGCALSRACWEAAMTRAGQDDGGTRHLVASGRVTAGVLELCRGVALYDAAFFVLAPGWRARQIPARCPALAGSPRGRRAAGGGARDGAPAGLPGPHLARSAPGRPAARAGRRRRPPRAPGRSGGADRCVAGRPTPPHRATGAVRCGARTEQPAACRTGPAAPDPGTGRRHPHSDGHRPRTGAARLPHPRGTAPVWPRPAW